MYLTKVTCPNCCKEFEVAVWQLHAAAPIYCPHCKEQVDKLAARAQVADKRHTT